MVFEKFRKRDTSRLLKYLIKVLKNANKKKISSNLHTTVATVHPTKRNSIEMLSN